MCGPKNKTTSHLFSLPVSELAGAYRTLGFWPSRLIPSVTPAGPILPSLELVELRPRLCSPLHPAAAVPEAL